MRYRVVHETRYSCSELVSVGHNEARLKLRSTPRQFLIGHTLDINPLPSVRTDSVDYFGNCVTRFSFNHGYQQLVVNSTNEVEIVDAIPLTDIGPAWEELTPVNAEGHGHNDLGVIEFRFESPRCRVVNDLAYYARATFTPGKPVAQAAIELMERIHREFQFDPAATTVATPVEQVFRFRRGVCQDFAHLFISMLRSLGLCSRYVSGYLRTLPPPGQAKLVGADASHAWLSLWCGRSLGWLDLDPTTNLLPGQGMSHITLAWGRDYGDIAPLKGVFTGGGHCSMAVGVDVSQMESHTEAETGGSFAR